MTLETTAAGREHHRSDRIGWLLTALWLTR